MTESIRGPLKRAVLTLASALVLALTAACVQMPTEKNGTPDMRPQISFRMDPASSPLASGRVLVDNLDMGAAGDFVEGKNALKILPGTHQLRVVSNGQVVLDERFYAGDGANRSFVLK
jgi:hypothetical protein